MGQLITSSNAQSHAVNPLHFSSTEHVSHLTPEEKIINGWKQWAENAPAGNNEKREMALARVMECVEKENNSLHLSGLNLSSIPELPQHITYLNLSENQLTSLPELPTMLEGLQLSENPLEECPALPETLTELNVSGCELTSLPALPATLQRLDISENSFAKIEGLPANLLDLDASNNPLLKSPELPDSLQTLLATDCQLTQLPKLPLAIRKVDVEDNEIKEIKELPPQLEEFTVSGNPLVNLPALPASLIILQAKDCQLTQLPDLPGKIEKVNVSRNQIKMLPAFPKTLKLFKCPHNQLQQIPVDRFSIAGSVVDIRDNNLPQYLLDCYSDITSHADYVGAKIICQDSSAPKTATLADRVVKVFPIGEMPDMRLKFTAFQQEPGAESFSNCLDLLYQGYDVYGRGQFNGYFTTWLNVLSELPELRAETFAMAHQAQPKDKSEAVSLMSNRILDANRLMDAKRELEQE